MKPLALIASSALLIGVSATPSFAECYPDPYARQIDLYVAGGMTIQEAFKIEIEENRSINTRKCLITIKGEIRKYPASYPYAHRALYGN